MITIVHTKYLHLLRHGEPEITKVYLGRTDARLSQTGHEQVAQALEKNYGWELIVSSPLQRCLNTAIKYSEAWQIPLITLTELQEYNFGLWDGKTFDEIYQQSPQRVESFWAKPDTNPPPDAENLDNFKQRLEIAYTKLEMRAEQQILVITHAGVIRGILGHLLNLAICQWHKLHLDYARFTSVRLGNDDGFSWFNLMGVNTETPYKSNKIKVL